MLAYIICEQAYQSKVKILQEANISDDVTKSKHVIVETVLQDADEFNRNGRNYPLNILLGGLNAAHIMELLSRKSWCGEFGHPNVTGNSKLDAIRQVKIDPQFVSHRINKWWNEGSRIMGIVQGFGPFGKFFDEMIMEDMESAYSLRAIGGVEITPRGHIVKGKLHITTYDEVFVPSHMQAYQTKIIQKTSQEYSKFVQESFISIQQQNLQEITNYLQSESSNISIISEIMELYNSSVCFSENMKNAIISDTEKQCKVVVPIEEYLYQEAVNVLKNI